MTTREHLSESIKKQIAGQQFHKCANGPDIELYRLTNYQCPLWISPLHNGVFDEAGYDIDHIEEYSLTQNNAMDNLQALCKNCHSVKTKRFMNKHKHKQNKKQKEIKIGKKMDVYEQFLNECTEEMKGGRIKYSIVYNTFKNWYKQTYTSESPGRNIASKGLLKHIDIKKRRLNGNSANCVDGLRIIT